MNEALTVIGVLVDHRADRAPGVQEVITRYGEDIIARMGVPSPSKEKGLITLVFKGETTAAQQFYRELGEISGVAVEMLHFDQEI
ncbi:MAG TPA: hypothetical protein VEC37_13060 [Bacillota bacterium]|nr:hypothetical protein [Bacillota bacterium]